jgi:hypothetical protein
MELFQTERRFFNWRNPMKPRLIAAAQLLQSRWTRTFRPISPSAAFPDSSNRLDRIR